MSVESPFTLCEEGIKYHKEVFITLSGEWKHEQLSSLLQGLNTAYALGRESLMPNSITSSMWTNNDTQMCYLSSYVTLPVE